MNPDILSSTLQTLVPIICEHTGFRPDEVLLPMRLREDLCIDSLALHAILMDVEGACGVMPGSQGLADAVSLADLATEIARLRGAS